MCTRHNNKKAVKGKTQYCKGPYPPKVVGAHVIADAGLAVEGLSEAWGAATAHVPSSITVAQRVSSAIDGQQGRQRARW